MIKTLEAFLAKNSKVVRDAAHWSIFGMYALVVAVKVLEVSAYQQSTLLFITA